MKQNNSVLQLCHAPLPDSFSDDSLSFRINSEPVSKLFIDELTEVQDRKLFTAADHPQSKVTCEIEYIYLLESNFHWKS